MERKREIMAKPNRDTKYKSFKIEKKLADNQHIVIHRQCRGKVIHGGKDESNQKIHVSDTDIAHF